MNKIFGGISIKSIKLILSILALGMLVALGAAYDDHSGDYGGYGDHGGDHGGYGDHGGDHGGYGDHDGMGGHDTFDGRAGGKYIDWLNPGGYYYTSWYYPTYTYSWYPAYTYNYPVYYYTEPVVYPTYYYDPVVYDPWYATNVYGWGGATYYYTNSWTWSHHGGFFF